MTLKKEKVGPWLPKEVFKLLICPICEGKKYTEVLGSGIYCNNCNATFRLRSTAGDYGVVIDCIAEFLYPSWGIPFAVGRLNGNYPEFVSKISDLVELRNDDLYWNSNIESEILVKPFGRKLPRWQKRINEFLSSDCPINDSLKCVIHDEFPDLKAKEFDNYLQTLPYFFGNEDYRNTIINGEENVDRVDYSKLSNVEKIKHLDKINPH